MRWLSRRSDTTCAAAANAASAAAASPQCQSMQTLPGTSSAICGAPGARASAARGDRRQRRPVDRDVLGGIERLGARLGDDQRDRLADVAHLVAGQQRLRRKGERLAGLHVGFHRGTHRLQPIGVGHPRRSAPQARPASHGPPSHRSARSAHARAASAAPPRAPAPSKRRSSRYAPWPVVKRASSRRLGVSPMMARLVIRLPSACESGADRIP